MGTKSSALLVLCTLAAEVLKWPPLPRETKNQRRFHLSPDGAAGAARTAIVWPSRRAAG
eukprot:SAG25_NODE_10264_length_340_cov_1.165975_1_plen_58_part_01